MDVDFSNWESFLQTAGNAAIDYNLKAVAPATTSTASTGQLVQDGAYAPVRAVATNNLVPEGVPGWVWGAVAAGALVVVLLVVRK